MLARRVWPSRPTFESPFIDFNQVRQQMLRLFDTVAADTRGDAATPHGRQDGMSPVQAGGKGSKHVVGMQ
jgi:hypothetical protein